MHSRDLLQCNRCQQQACSTRGTLFADATSPLRSWFLAIYSLSQHGTASRPWRCAGSSE
ncbi:hypothetical protein XthCFBP4691_04670 [Xanthomonas theicola]|nr:hypothetical protein XthCFBP4691_04670 [Xanthomonas theicola]